MTPLVGDPCSGGLNKSKDQEFLSALFFRPHCARASSAYPVFWGLLPSVVIPEGWLKQIKRPRVSLGFIFLASLRSSKLGL